MFHATKELQKMSKKVIDKYVYCIFQTVDNNLAIVGDPVLGGLESERRWGKVTITSVVTLL